MDENERAQILKKRDDRREQALFSLIGRVHGVDEHGQLSGGDPHNPNYRKIGKVTIWDLVENRYVTMWPVDAAERIAIGCAVQEKPVS